MQKEKVAETLRFEIPKDELVKLWLATEEEERDWEDRDGEKWRKGRRHFLRLRISKCCLKPEAMVWSDLETRLVI